MKSTIMLIAAIVCFPPTGYCEQGTEQGKGKDMCLVDTNLCSENYNLVDKIARLKAAIETGTKVYTPQELERLEYSLEDSLATAGRLNIDPSQVPENKE